MNIKEFKKGDFITRKKASRRGDRSYIKEKFEFIGFYDDEIILYCFDKYLGPEITKLPLEKDFDDWTEDWDFYNKKFSVSDKSDKRIATV